MMTDMLASAPVLSTPDNHILTETEPLNGTGQSRTLTDEQLAIRYEIRRTVDEIRRHKWHRVALQFPDHMLSHSPRVCEALSRGLSRATKPALVAQTDAMTLDHDDEQLPVRLTILADTSYGSCCVDEIAAEHVEADAVIHYGRACLSPIARLPVLHIYTEMHLDRTASIAAFTEAFPDFTTKVILTGDIPYASHIDPIAQGLRDIGYTAIFPAQIVHDPSSLIPNRTVPPGLENHSQLADWHLFHIAEPPTSLLLTLSSRVKSIRVYNPTPLDAAHGDKTGAYEASTAMLLGRRYALVTSMASVSTWGILINTLSVKNYLTVVEHVKKQIAAADKKSYLFVVGKLNAAKVANFAEIEGWVVIGCWESSLIDSRDFFKPIITPFELDMALAGDDSRVWTGAWQSDFDEILSHGGFNSQETTAEESDDESDEAQDLTSDEESAPPEFDLRTGRYVTQAGPAGAKAKLKRRTLKSEGNNGSSQALIKRANADLVAVNGVASPAAAFLKAKRTWKGLGSDFEVKYDEEEQEGASIEEGRTGMARGYSVGDSLRT